ncbi:MAG: 2OG-Fe(II) oxygenase [Casimicrobiaceae bacterium]|nr:2OG-Fe(II) oxygenase [Casimicrobiaceae bacterium]
MRIPNFLEDEEARALASALLDHVSWDWVFCDSKGQVQSLPEGTIASWAQKQVDSVRRSVYEHAREHFQFSYRKFSVLAAVRAGVALPEVLASWLESFASAESLSRLRALTGAHDIQRVDAQITLYRPGDFLTVHTDDHDQRYERRVAYVYNLCPYWRADWGGLLLFHNDAGAIVDAWLPAWNTLNLFSVPQPHSVSMVTPFAGVPRLSITGWFTA